MALRVLLIQAEPHLTEPLLRYFKQRGDEVWQAWDLGQGQALLEQVRPQLMVMDLHFSSQEWYAFLRQARSANPGLKVIMTNRYPDLQRELRAREQGVRVFLRQPFTPRWIEQALQQLEEDTVPRPPRPVKSPSPHEVRMPMRVKITLPYLLLAILFALASAYLISRVALESVQERFLNQLVKTGLQTQDGLVQEENRLLETLRLIANTQGLPEAMQSKQAETLRELLLPVAANSQEEEIILLDTSGNHLLTLTHVAGGGVGEYRATTGGSEAASWPFVRRVLEGQSDAAGDKFAGRGSGPLGEMIYVAGPLFDSAGNHLGAALVGKSLLTLARELSRDTLSDVTFYDARGQPLASSLNAERNQLFLSTGETSSVLERQDRSSQTRDLAISNLRYTEVLAPWEVRGGEDLGVMGVSLAQAFLIRTSRATQIEIFLFVATAIFLVIAVGVSLAGLITHPLMKLVAASSEVASGNLEVKVDISGNDELAILANAFNRMVAGLQEGSIYRDLLGRTVSPEVREQLRQTFSSGNLRLEGQEAVATVLMTDIRGFTTLSEKVPPSTVLHWLNEYFGQIVPIVTHYGGVVNQFEGDAMLAFFGTLPRLLSPKQSALAACQAAVEVLQAIERLNNQRRARGEPQLITGIGINTGVVIAGGLGTSDRLHYTIIGDTVNSAQRLESLTRGLFDSSAILVSHSTFQSLAEHQARFHFEALGYHQVRGKAERIQVYRLHLPRNPIGWEGML
jgi:class 3 adenylate cyclase/CheY-like chemotaxis protein